MAQDHDMNTATVPLPGPLPLVTQLTRHVPPEMINLIPEFNGDSKMLSLFLRKCDYVVKNCQGNGAVNVYLIHCMTSKLTGKAASLISSRDDIETYDELKELLVKYFGDHRSEESVANELEFLKIMPHESYQDFCCRIQEVRALLLSKVNQESSDELKDAKTIIYNNASMNVFLYNLPEYLVNILRMKNPSTLEQALEYVIEEDNFKQQYAFKSKLLHQPKTIYQPPNPIHHFNFGQNRNEPFGINPSVFGSTCSTSQTGQPGICQTQVQTAFRPQPALSSQGGHVGFQPQGNMFGMSSSSTSHFGFKSQTAQIGYKHEEKKTSKPGQSENNLNSSNKNKHDANSETDTQQNKDVFSIKPN